MYRIEGGRERYVGDRLEQVELLLLKARALIGTQLTASGLGSGGKDQRTEVKRQQHAAGESQDQQDRQDLLFLVHQKCCSETISWDHQNICLA